MPSGLGKGSFSTRFQKGIIPNNKGTGEANKPKTCVVCGKVYFNKQKTITCSPACGYAKIRSNPKKRINRICAVCGKEFSIPRAYVVHDGPNAGSYCSYKCRFSKKINYSDKQKQDARNAVTSAIMYKGFVRKPCEICGEVKTDAHHYKGYKKENWLDIQWLCEKHHNQEHERLRRMGMTDLL